ncbi:MAG: hypothetical protein J6X30_01845, partial [Clostridia bacterium]|nr:hypothetical protein [Clostridia bacterium]
TYKSDYTDALGHDYQAGTVTNPTCTEQGYTTYVCSHDSSHTEKRDYTDALGHDYRFVEYTVEPTCEAGGKALYRCSRCPAEETRDVDALGHNYQAGTVTNPTCTEQGYTTYVCTHDASHTEKRDFTDALGHDLTWEITKSPTTEEEGEMTAHCSRCDETRKASIGKLTSKVEGAENPEGTATIPDNAVISLESESVQDETVKAVIAKLPGQKKNNFLAAFSAYALVPVDAQTGVIYPVDGPVTITMELPEEWKNVNGLQLALIDENGGVTEVPVTLNGDGTATVQAPNLNGTFALFNVPAEEPATTTPGNPSKTGDALTTGLWALLLTALAMAVVCLKKLRDAKN